MHFCDKASILFLMHICWNLMSNLSRLLLRLKQIKGMFDYLYFCEYLWIYYILRNIHCRQNTKKIYINSIFIKNLIHIQIEYIATLSAKVCNLFIITLRLTSNLFIFYWLTPHLHSVSLNPSKDQTYFQF